MVNQRENLYQCVQSLEEVSDIFTTSIQSASSHTTKIVDEILEIDQWLWLSTLSTSIAVLLIWTLLLSAVICANCGCEARVAPTIYISIGLVVTFTLGLWIVVSGAMILGGNGDMFLCKPLQDDPNYATLTLLLDHPGLLYQNGGLFSNILAGNDSINVPIKEVLR